MATYTVKSGDTFGEIAQRYGLSVSQLKSINPQKEDINRIEIGERIIIPGGAESTVQETVASAETPIANKQKDFAILNPELSYLFRKDPEVGVGRTGTYVNVPMEQQPIGPDTVPEMPEGFQMPKQEYSYGQLASDIGGTLKEKVGDPLMSGLQYLNQNVLQKDLGGDVDPVETPMEILKEDPVPEAAQIIKDSAEFVRQETPVVVEETLKKIPLTDKELKENLVGVDENLNLMPEDVDQDPTQGGSVTEDNKAVALKIASDLSSGSTPVIESTETTIEEPQGADLEQELPQQISIQDINNLEKSGQITPKTKEAFDDYLEGGFDFFGNTAVIQKIDREIEANRVRLQEISRGEIKPFFGKEDTGKKIMAAIAAGLGAYASAITGGPNSALQIINDAIDRDLAVQKEKLERQRMAIIDQNDFLQQQKADLLAYAGLELDRMSTIAGTKNDALKDELELLKTNQELVINSNKIEKQEREENEYEFLRTVTLADGVEGKFNNSVSQEEAPRLKRDIKRFVSGYNVLVGAPNLAESVADQITDAPSYSETFKSYEFIDKDGIKRNTDRKKKFADKQLEEESRVQVVDGVVITDDMITSADPVTFTKRGIINQLKDLAKGEKVQIVAGGKLTPAGVRIVQLDTFLRNYYQRYVMQTGANLTGTEVTQVSDILPRPSKYAIASGNYLKGLQDTENLLRSMYVNEVLAYTEKPAQRRVQKKPKSKLNQKDLKFAGDAS
jgi:murein DD-endopeptidase MepM/ murein hydrolase activator NlpD